MNLLQAIIQASDYDLARKRILAYDKSKVLKEVPYGNGYVMTEKGNLFFMKEVHGTVYVTHTHPLLVKGKSYQDYFYRVQIGGGKYKQYRATNLVWAVFTESEYDPALVIRCADGNPANLRVDNLERVYEVDDRSTLHKAARKAMAKPIVVPQYGGVLYSKFYEDFVKYMLTLAPDLDYEEARDIVSEAYIATIGHTEDYIVAMHNWKMKIKFLFLDMVRKHNKILTMIEETTRYSQTCDQFYEVDLSQYLPNKTQRKVFQLTMQGYEQDEIARILNMPEVVVGQHLNRAVRHIRSII